ncbi:hypothetical protein [Lichenifustis flavocetrariae]|uniref:Uncharacterized protein n=1 Tax=Lichenifustis flavocetrariae TaxID=2949735 RepID=A0AA42CMP4_9HYPH|nr:hypothetical protein [Lichenifustis flavocetrariae]MCW6508597.1 hypothetical protein [Lichenifustis flavocetrariae]
MILHLDAEAPSRLGMICAILGVMTISALGLRFWLPPDARRAVVLSVLGSGFIYLALGLVTRFVVQHHRSRWQMVTLLIGVAAIEALRRRPGDWRHSASNWILGSAAVCLGVLMAKWVLEPGAISATAARLHDRILQ